MVVRVIPLTGFQYYVTAAIVHRTVTELFVRDLYVCKFLDFKSIHEHEKYIDILSRFFRGVLVIIGLFRMLGTPRKGTLQVI